MQMVLRHAFCPLRFALFQIPMPIEADTESNLSPPKNSHHYHHFFNFAPIWEW